LMWQPVVAAVLAWIILNEPLTVTRACGGLVIIAGILVATWRRQSQDRLINSGVVNKGS
jgi:drug/metabolite transporter (DMT)-like permease